MAQSVGPDVIERIRSAILGGDSIRSAAKKAGVSFHTAKKYLPVEVLPASTNGTNGHHHATLELAIPEGPTGPLSDVEAENRREWIAIVHDGLDNWVRVSGALLNIRDSRVYRSTHGTFDEFCRDEFGFTDRRARQLMTAGGVLENLRGDESAPLPDTEWSVRHLAKLPPDEQQAAWDEARRESTNGTPTGEGVREVVARRTRSSGGSKRDTTIPPDSRVEESERGSEPTGPDEATDRTIDEYLESLPARKDLSDPVRKRFDVEAVLFLNLTPIRRRFAAECRTMTNEAKRVLKGHIGPYMGRHFSYLRYGDPAHWKACKDCYGSGLMELIGKCPSCHGEGYYG
jgi:hypothetical protein